MLIGIAFFLVGLLYLINPDAFRIGVFKKMPLTTPTPSPSSHHRIIRVIAGILLVIGLLMMWFARAAVIS
ncbi:MAG: DUF4345 family protein [Bacteroidota bacterium]